MASVASIKAKWPELYPAGADHNLLRWCDRWEDYKRAAEYVIRFSQKVGELQIVSSILFQMKMRPARYPTDKQTFVIVQAYYRVALEKLDWKLVSEAEEMRAELMEMCD